jgi:hypothetical protein
MSARSEEYEVHREITLALPCLKRQNGLQGLGKNKSGCIFISASTFICNAFLEEGVMWQFFGMGLATDYISYTLVS